MTFPQTVALASLTPPLNPQNNNPFDINAALQSLFGSGATSVLADLQSIAGVGAGASYVARAVVTALSGAYGGSTTNTLTASANAVFGTQDGVSTLAVGDVVFLPGAATHITTGSDSGPWTIASLGAAGTAKWVLTRPNWWNSSATIPLGGEISIGGEGTTWGGSQWRSFAAKASVIDTADPLFYPHVTSVVSGASTAGLTPTVTTLYVSPQAVVLPIPASTAGSAPAVAWHMSTTTSGYAGSSALAATASDTTAGHDTSTVRFVVTNW